MTTVNQAPGSRQNMKLSVTMTGRTNGFAGMIGKYVRVPYVAACRGPRSIMQLTPRSRPGCAADFAADEEHAAVDCSRLSRRSKHRLASKARV